MHFFSTSLAIILVSCTLSFAARLDGNYVEVYEIDKNTLPVPEQLPPQDPAIHSFPTVPTAPLIPRCGYKGYFRDPFNCRKFYFCQHENAIPAGFYCQSDLVFNTLTNSCDNGSRVEC